MKPFEKKLLKGAWELCTQISKSNFALEHQEKYEISREEQQLIRMNIHAMEISYGCLMRRIELRGLKEEYIKYIIKQTYKYDLPY